MRSFPCRVIPRESRQAWFILMARRWWWWYIYSLSSYHFPPHHFTVGRYAKTEPKVPTKSDQSAVFCRSEVVEKSWSKGVLKDKSVRNYSENISRLPPPPSLFRVRGLLADKMNKTAAQSGNSCKFAEVAVGGGGDDTDAEPICDCFTVAMSF